MSNLSIQIAATGLDAQQAGMDAVAQNLANASTPGYVAERVALTPNPSTNMMGVGDGVKVAGITQVPAQLAQIANQQAQASLSSATARQQVLTAVQNAFPEPNSGQGISNQLATFWSSWDAIVQNPSSLAPYTQVVNEAQGLAHSLNQASAAVSTAASNAASQLGATVSTDNQLLAQVASLNGQISQVAASGASPNSLIDQQNQLVTQLASDLGATATPLADGGVTLSVGGATLVQGSVATKLQVGPNPTDPSGQPYAVLDTANNRPLASLSGTAGGLVTTLNNDLPAYQSQLDTVANDLGTGVNALLNGGTMPGTTNTSPAGGTAETGGSTTAGTAGQALFVTAGSSPPTAPATFTAATIAVNPNVAANPMGTLAVSGAAVGTASPGNASNAQAIAEIGSGTTFAANLDYTAFIQNIGSQVQSVNGQVTAETSVANAASQNLQEIAGVNTNTQMIDLLNYQHAYQASAQVVATANTAIQSLLQAV